MGQQRHLIAFVLLAVYLTLFFQLGDLPFIGADEPRYARISEEMLLAGDFVTPRLEGSPWLEKPPLLFWVQALSFRVFGVSEAAARLPVALLGLLCALAAGGLARHLAGFRAGVLAILILCTSTLFFIFARAGSTDMPLTACLTVSLVCGYRAAGSRNPLWSLLSGAALGAAALAKGPIALILFGGIFTVYFLWIEKLEWGWRHLLAGTAAFLATSVPWYWSVWVENGYSFFVTFWLNHHLARVMSDLHHHSQPFWYYLAVLAVGFFPWTPFLAGSFVRLWRSRTGAGPDHSQVFLWIWVALPVVFFSLSESKLPGYVLPVVPALALLVAREWDRDPAGETAPARPLRLQWLVLQGLALLMAAAIVYMSRTYYASDSGLWVALPLAAAVLWGARRVTRRTAGAGLSHAGRRHGAGGGSRLLVPGPGGGALPFGAESGPGVPTHDQRGAPPGPLPLFPSHGAVLHRLPGDAGGGPEPGASAALLVPTPADGLLPAHQGVGMEGSGGPGGVPVAA